MFFGSVYFVQEPLERSARVWQSHNVRPSINLLYDFGVGEDLADLEFWELGIDSLLRFPIHDVGLQWNSQGLTDCVDRQHSCLNFLANFVFVQLVLKMVGEAVGLKSSQERNWHAIFQNLGNLATDQESRLDLRNSQYSISFVDDLLINILINWALLDTLRAVFWIDKLTLDNFWRLNDTFNDDLYEMAFFELLFWCMLRELEETLGPIFEPKVDNEAFGFFGLDNSLKYHALRHRLHREKFVHLSGI